MHQETEWDSEIRTLLKELKVSPRLLRKFRDCPAILFLEGLGCEIPDQYRAFLHMVGGKCLTLGRRTSGQTPFMVDPSHWGKDLVQMESFKVYQSACGSILWPLGYNEGSADIKFLFDDFGGLYWCSLYYPYGLFYLGSDCMSGLRFFDAYEPGIEIQTLLHTPDLSSNDIEIFRSVRDSDNRLITTDESVTVSVNTTEEFIDPASMAKIEHLLRG